MISRMGRGKGREKVTPLDLLVVYVKQLAECPPVEYLLQLLVFFVLFLNIIAVMMMMMESLLSSYQLAAFSLRWAVYDAHVYNHSTYTIYI